MNLIAFLIAAILFFVVAISDPDQAELIPWGLGFLATGLLLGGLPIPSWPRRD